MTVKTELQWTYTPGTYFESATTFAFAEGQLKVEIGNAIYTVATAVDPLPPVVRASIETEVAAVFGLRQLVTHRPFTLHGPSVTQHRVDGVRTIGVGIVDTINNGEPGPGLECGK